MSLPPILPNTPDFCGCCAEDAPRTPFDIFNRPGLDALQYRVGTYATFRRAMLDAIAAEPRLAGLADRDPDDYAITLIELFAAVADVLAFYNERIANELYLRTAQKDIAALSSLIDDLFQMAQLDAGGLPLELGMNSISDLISDTLESFSELVARQGVTLNGEVEPGVGSLRMDTQRIGRVLNNLISNALRHTPRGGYIHVHAASVPEGVRVEVTDSGEGIRPEDLPYVFDRFYRGEKSRNRATGGTGLGLAIARTIARAHGGNVELRNDGGVGIEALLVLPRRVGPMLSTNVGRLRQRSARSLPDDSGSRSQGAVAHRPGAVPPGRLRRKQGETFETGSLAE